MVTFCCLCAAIFTAFLCEWKQIKLGQSLLYNILASAIVGVAVYFLTKVDISTKLVHFRVFVALCSFLSIFIVSTLVGNSSTAFSVCFIIGKRMFEATMITIVVLIISYIALVLCMVYSRSLLNDQGLSWGFVINTLQHKVLPIMFAAFCPICTLYNVRKDCLGKVEGNQPAFGKFVESAFVYTIVALSVGLMLYYTKQLLGLATAFVTPRYTDWGSVITCIALFFASILVFLVASAPEVKKNHPKLKILPFSKRWLSIVWFILAFFAAIKIVGNETVFCITHRSWAVWLAWITIVYMVIACRVPLPKTIALCVTILTGCMFYFEEQLDDTENRIFAFLEKEQFWKDGVISKRKNLPIQINFNLSKCVLWLTQHESVISSRLGKICDNEDKQYCKPIMRSGDVWAAFCDDKASFLTSRVSLEIPLRLPFRAYRPHQSSQP
jgi:hypothetical protein